MGTHISGNQSVVYRGGNNDVSLFGELKRRNVFRFGMKNTLATRALTRVASLLLDSLRSPPAGWTVLSAKYIATINRFNQARPAGRECPPYESVL